MWMNRAAVKWCPVTTSYLQEHQTDSIMQLTIALGMSRAAIKRKLDELSGKAPPVKKQNKRTKIGKRADLGIFVRSSWEANVCRYLKSQGIQYTYETKVYSFLEHGIKHGTVSYCPDIHTSDGRIIEVKGLLDRKGATAIRRFKKYYLSEFTKLTMIVGRPGTKADKFAKELGISIFAYYNELQKRCKNIIPNWER